MASHQCESETNFLTNREHLKTDKRNACTCQIPFQSSKLQPSLTYCMWDIYIFFIYLQFFKLWEKKHYLKIFTSILAYISLCENHIFHQFFIFISCCEKICDHIWDDSKIIPINKCVSFHYSCNDIIPMLLKSAAAAPTVCFHGGSIYTNGHQAHKKSNRRPKK